MSDETREEFRERMEDKRMELCRRDDTSPDQDKADLADWAYDDKLPEDPDTPILAEIIKLIRTSTYYIVTGGTGAWRLLNRDEIVGRTTFSPVDEDIYSKPPCQVLTQLQALRNPPTIESETAARKLAEDKVKKLMTALHDAEMELHDVRPEGGDVGGREDERMKNKPKRTLRDMAKDHGIDINRVADNQDELDLESGKGDGPDDVTEMLVLLRRWVAVENCETEGNYVQDLRKIHHKTKAFLRSLDGESA